ncbi:unannotated protein [freshwater metagenome]|uniref:Unannotated protein n=1 Tax=freshwater metagenome TaxID=449393 RepID=A0A6J7NZE3_9ZZZZ
MLGGSQQTERVVAVAFEAEHRVDDVLEHARAGQTTLLGDVADHQHREIAPFGLGDEAMGAATHLHHASRRRRQRRVGNGLDAVDDNQLWLDLVDGGHDVRQ